MSHDMNDVIAAIREGIETDPEAPPAQRRKNIADALQNQARVPTPDSPGKIRLLLGAILLLIALQAMWGIFG